MKQTNNAMYNVLLRPLSGGDSLSTTSHSAQPCGIKITEQEES